MISSKKTVASVSFLSDRTISMDVEEVTSIDLGQPMEVEPGKWFAELIVRSGNGILSVQMLADTPDRFQVITAEKEEN
ncbi:hypothetical protein GALL_316890 [mine drainage metagenome]|uniref:Uncharacterized protein n=1 Tax=mine drainage metagenome TaxID=410659 RepID=A0A1J5R320_9ZZZZ